MTDFLPNALKALEKAEDAIETAKYDLKGGFETAAVNRGYYAMFYYMTALLILHNVHTKTHQGIQAKFRELYIKNGVFDIAISEQLQAAFNLRQQVDYDLDTRVDAEDVQRLITAAEEFYALTKSHLKAINDQA